MVMDLIGPRVAGPGGKAEHARVPFKAVLPEGKKSVDIEYQKNKFELQAGKWSDWKEVTFSLGFLRKARGIFKFYLEEREPEFKLYVTAIHIDPEKPALPISHPFFYSVYLAKKFGPYATLGLAEDTWALNERVIDEKAFLKQAYLIKDEREKMFFHALEKTNLIGETPGVIYRRINFKIIGESCFIVLSSMTRCGVNTTCPGFKRYIGSQYNQRCPVV